MRRDEALIKVERGRPDEAELAAVVAVLLSLRAGAQGAPDGAPDGALEELPSAEIGWWRAPDAYAAPESWR
ncbi:MULTISPECIES: acyl-CoA carboxylase epsilon subunit [unclassified Streptomyces]|uniref:acyl-CoA carboxylase subunit epsilon n=1 Tax=unclassified Streptomyces TaxID=2593676 RepID=UPI0036E36D53